MLPPPENFTVPKPAEIAADRKFMNSVEEALRGRNFCAVAS